MAFLDNSGDIILDAVLTDTGRFRLAKGDGTFRIVKFALGDDEINYAEYDKNHASGSAYYDLQILQTPILEAFTNNTSLMKSKLISIPRTNLLYLPVIRLSGTSTGGSAGSIPVGGNWNDGYFLLCVNEDTVGNASSNPQTEGLLVGSNSNNVDDNTIRGRLNGFQALGTGQNFIRTDQGLDTTEISDEYTIDADLNETQYIIEIDNRFGSIVSAPGTGDVRASVSFIDDDNIASYYLSSGTDRAFVTGITGGNADGSTIEGPRGTQLRFRIQASTDLATSDYLFTQLGSTTTETLAKGTGTMPVRYIDSIVKVTGATTGYRIDIPVRFVRKSGDIST